MILFPNEMREIALLVERLNMLINLTPEQQKALGLPDDTPDVFNTAAEPMEKNPVINLQRFEIAAHDDAKDVLGWVEFYIDDYIFRPNTERSE